MLFRSSQLNVTSLKHEGAGLNNLVLDSSGNTTFGGRVTMPNQPMFLIRKTGSQPLSGGTTSVVSYETVRDNNGGHYSTSTNSFTAPVNGSYVFSALVNVTRNGASYFSLQLQINGAGVPSASSLFYNSPSYTGVSITYAITLSAGDAVRVVLAQDSNALMDNSGYFSGYLIG